MRVLMNTFLGIATCALLTWSVSSSNIQVQIDASWGDTPLLAEASEAVAALSPEKFWSFFELTLPMAEDLRLQLLAEGETALAVNITSPQIEQYGKAISKITGVLFSRSQQNLARAELAARAFSPLVQAHHEMARACLNSSVHRDTSACHADAFVELGENRVVCSVDELTEALRLVAKNHEIGCPGMPTIRFDVEHEFPTSSKPSASATCTPHIILYGALGTSRTHDFYRFISTAVKAGTVTAWFRHFIPVSDTPREPLVVMGYGVTLDVKDVEYKAVDENAINEQDIPLVNGINMTTLLSRFPALSANLTRFAKKAAVSGLSADLDLKVWEVQKLGFQAAHIVLTSDQPLETFLDISHNFPARVGYISRLEATDEFDATVSAVEQLQMTFGEGANRVWLDGRFIDVDKHDLFALLAAIRVEEALALKVLQGLSGKPNSMVNHDAAVTKIIQCPVTAPQEGERPRLYIPADHVVWVNDIERDETYGHLDRRVSAILEPGHYGMPRFPRKNLFNVIYVIDPTDTNHLSIFASFLRLYQQGAAIRFGVVFRFPDVPKNPSLEGDAVPTAITLAAALEALSERSPSDAAMFLVRLAYAVSRGEELSKEAIRSNFRAFLRTDLSPTADTIEFMREWNQMVGNLGLTSLPVAVFNGEIHTENIEEIVYRAFNNELLRAKEMVRAKTVKGEGDVYTEIIGEGVRRYQPALFNPAQYQTWEAVRWQSLLIGAAWAYSTDHDLEVSDLSHLLFLNASSVRSIRDVVRAYQYIHGCQGPSCKFSRLSVIPCGRNAAAKVIAGLLDAAISLPHRKRASFVIQFLLKFMNAMASDDILADDKQVNAATASILRELGAPYASMRPWSPNIDTFEAMCNDPSTNFSGTLMQTNGRIIQIDESFSHEDFTVLEKMEREQRAKSLATCIESLDFRELTENQISSDHLDSDFYATKIAVIHSIVTSELIRNGPREKSRMLPARGARHGFAVGSNRSRHELVAIVDPLSRPAQKIGALAKYLMEAMDVSIRIHMSPIQRIQKVPLKNYYHFVSDFNLHFANGTVVPPTAQLKNLPTNVLLTLGVDDPDSWMVFADVAEADLDNLKLTHDANVISAKYKLQSLVITGTCIDLDRKSPPRGLPIVLSDFDGVRDTLVMSNYGYFQLQGHPGLGMLTIQEGRGSQVFRIDSVNQLNSSAVLVSSFGGAHVLLYVRRNEGFETVELLDDTEADPKAAKEPNAGGLFSWFTQNAVDTPRSAWPPQPGNRSEKPKRPTLNIFSLASGHLYERFLRIMIYTVMKSSSDRYGSNTTRIKFWLVENPMSPRFKRFLPKLAEKYGFEYGLVKYKWPHWLTRQTEKQRMIWAYKVLFLDVLFPLDVEKIIFVDADQIVRADLHELYNLDLQGHAVAYTPFCRTAARNETRGFRFWDSGYWKDHLAGKPYHISAIYVVDLRKFRQIAAGDRYRVVYDNLAQDPNSLANLDQDLPNFAQHQVPIYSLPEEWLWCETWCSDESKLQAKTIDLCNNPLTKTPKLENAKRIIPEWTELDTELSSFEQNAQNN